MSSGRSTPTDLNRFLMIRLIVANSHNRWTSVLDPSISGLLRATVRNNGLGTTFVDVMPYFFDNDLYMLIVCTLKSGHAQSSRKRDPPGVDLLFPVVSTGDRYTIQFDPVSIEMITFTQLSSLDLCTLVQSETGES